MKSTDTMAKAADRISELRPAYKEILGFYKEVFRIQAQSLCHIRIEPVIIEPDLLRIKVKNGFPLIDPSEFRIDQAFASQTLQEIIGLAKDLSPGLSSCAGILENALLETVFDPETLFSSILENDTRHLNNLSAMLDILPEELTLFGYLAMNPAIRACSEQLKTYLNDTDWSRKGYCPVCGHRPGLAYLDQDGRQFMCCSFCGHQWKVQRMGCMLCGSQETDHQHYFYNEEEPEYRVKLCNQCMQYLKIVDLRQMDRDFFADLESVATLHLDMQARAKGYSDESISLPVS